MREHIFAEGRFGRFSFKINMNHLFTLVFSQMSETDRAIVSGKIILTKNIKYIIILTKLKIRDLYSSHFLSRFEDKHQAVSVFLSEIRLLLLLPL